MIMKRNSLSILKFFNFYILAAAMMLASCSDMLDTDSDLVEFQEDNQLHSPTDSVYSVMGIIYKMQAIADRTVLLGEMRADLVTPTEYANADLKAIADFDIDGQNSYNQISDYYAVINNCNYYLANIDTALIKRGRKVFESEFAVVKTFRAWTYLQAALVYGTVPLVTEPLLTEKAAQEAMNGSYATLNDICNYFINDLAPYVDTPLPQMGSIDGQDSRKFFIPVRVMLGELCLWAGRYAEAAGYYHDYLTLRSKPITTGVSAARWRSTTNEFRDISYGFASSVSSSSGSECLAYIPMEYREFYGEYSQLSNVYSSTQRNNYYAQAVPSAALKKLSASQNYCMVFQASDTQRDTLYAPKENLLGENQVGDLRFCDSYSKRIVNQDQNSKYSAERHTVSKLNYDGVTLYRTNIVYLHFAEALNRAGYPQSAFAVLKYGLYDQTITEHIDSLERVQAGSLLSFDVNVFSQQNTQGVHARGCGNAEADTLYVLPQPTSALATRADTVAWQQPLVEDLIVDELALETAFEGQRFYDLMRVALRRGDAAYLAAPVAKRDGTTDDALYQKLLNQANWYLSK